VTFRVPQFQVPRLRGRARVALWAIVALIVLFILVGVYVGLYTDLLWYRSVGFSTVFSRRLTTQILDAIRDSLQPLGAAVVIEASHLCMMMRGVQKQNSVTTTSAFHGEFHKNETRSEFIKLISAKLN